MAGGTEWQDGYVLLEEEAASCDYDDAWQVQTLEGSCPAQQLYFSQHTRKVTLYNLERIHEATNLVTY